jgi:uncharacterized protein YdbL (DUF1318 family)
MKFSTLLVILLLSFSSFAEDVAPIAVENINAPEPENEAVRAEINVTSDAKYDCVKEKESIDNQMLTLGNCWKDEDCSYFPFGYPWQQGPCFFGIVGTSDNEKDKNLGILEKTLEYQNRCVMSNQEERQKYEDIAKQSTEASCKPEKLVCLRGNCRTASYAARED